MTDYSDDLKSSRITRADRYAEDGACVPRRSLRRTRGTFSEQLEQPLLQPTGFFALLDSRGGRSGVFRETASGCRRLFSTALAIFQVFSEHIFPSVSLPRFSFAGSTTAKLSALVGTPVAANQCARSSRIVQDTSARHCGRMEGGPATVATPYKDTAHCSTHM